VARPGTKRPEPEAEREVVVVGEKIRIGVEKVRTILPDRHPGLEPPRGIAFVGDKTFEEEVAIPPFGNSSVSLGLRRCGGGQHKYRVQCASFSRHRAPPQPAIRQEVSCRFEEDRRIRCAITIAFPSPQNNQAPCRGANTSIRPLNLSKSKR
jgi:hypothetical protein